MADKQKDQPHADDEQAAENPEQQSGATNYSHLNRDEEGDRRGKKAETDEEASDPEGRKKA